MQLRNAAAFVLLNVKSDIKINIQNELYIIYIDTFSAQMRVQFVTADAGLQQHLPAALNGGLPPPLPQPLLNPEPHNL
jgi:hypothetical protein